MLLSSYVLSGTNPAMNIVFLLYLLSRRKAREKTQKKYKYGNLTKFSLP